MVDGGRLGRSVVRFMAGTWMNSTLDASGRDPKSCVLISVSNDIKAA